MSNCPLPIFHGCFVKIEIKFVKHSANICNKWAAETVFNNKRKFLCLVLFGYQKMKYLFL